MYRSLGRLVCSGKLVTQRAKLIILSINQFSMLQNPAAVAHLSARMYPASLSGKARQRIQGLEAANGRAINN